MNKVLLILALVVTLGGCSQFDRVFSSAGDIQVSIVTVAVAGNTFDAVEATATNYLRLVKCNGSNGPICRSPTATKRIIPAIRAGRVARNNLEQFFIDHPGALGPKGDYDALLSAISTLQSIFNQYNIIGAN